MVSVIYLNTQEFAYWCQHIRTMSMVDHDIGADCGGEETFAGAVVVVNDQAWLAKSRNEIRGK